MESDSGIPYGEFIGRRVHLALTGNCWASGVLLGFANEVLRLTNDYCAGSETYIAEYKVVSFTVYAEDKPADGR